MGENLLQQQINPSGTYLRSTKPIHERKKKVQSAAPKRVEASGDDAAAAYETTIHQNAETYATAVPTSSASW
jgi:hypothetical protein